MDSSGVHHSQSIESQKQIQERIAEYRRGESIDKVHFDYVLQMGRSMNEEQVKSLQSQLEQKGFITLRTMNMTKDRILILIYLCEPSILLEQAETINMYKITNKQEDINHSSSTLNQKLYHIKHILSDKLHTQLNQLNPSILIYERLKKFTIRDHLLFTTDHNHIFTSAERLRIIYYYLHTIRVADLDLIHYLQSQKHLLSITPLHSQQTIQYTSNLEIEQYYGDNVSVYFEFMDYYQYMLLILSILSIVLLLIQYLHQGLLFFNPKVSYYAFAYSIIVMIWSTFFVIFWTRRESELCMRWGVFTGKTQNKTLDKNVHFIGYMRIKLTTGMMQLKYSHNKRLFHYFLSFIEALPILSVALLIKLIIFNVNGLITNRQSTFYWHRIAAFNQPGGILHNIPFISTILDLLTIITIFKMNLMYVQQCILSTKRENHPTQTAFQNSLIAKRFIFELINRFLHLFYIAFIEFDITTLKSLLIKLFILDELRRVIVESVLPMIMKKQYQSQALLKKNDSLFATKDIIDRVSELQLWEYDEFDDYIEVIFQYGYIVLFAAIFPLASPLSLLFNLIEVKSDRFKFGQKLYQRNLPTKVNGIGQWKTLLLILSVLSIYSNVSFLVFSYYDVFKNCHHQTNCEWDQLIILLFLFEHILLILKFALSKLIKNKPKWVRVLLRRLKLKGL